MRSNNRKPDSLRPISIERGLQHQADGSVLIRMGNTHVICGVSVEDTVPPFLKDKGQGWITAEYGMLPCATNSRYRRETNGQSGRTMEIQRLIGRSLRMMVDLKTIGERTIRVDCDVLNADGGTRTASITGGALALKDALKRLVSEGRLEILPDIMPVAAISAGILGGEAILILIMKRIRRLKPMPILLWLEMGAGLRSRQQQKESRLPMNPIWPWQVRKKRNC